MQCLFIPNCPKNIVGASHKYLNGEEDYIQMLGVNSPGIAVPRLNETYPADTVIIGTKGYLKKFIRESLVMMDVSKWFTQGEYIARRLAEELAPCERFRILLRTMTASWRCPERTRSRTQSQYKS